MYYSKAADLDYYNSVFLHARGRFRELPRLPWIEASINMPYLQACASYVFKQSFGAILLMCVALEQALRLAVVDHLRARSRPMSLQDAWSIAGEETLGGLLTKPRLSSSIEWLIPDAEDLRWWKQIAKTLRNKTFHMDIPHLVKVLGRDESFVGWYKEEVTDEVLFADRSWWGSFFHETQHMVARELMAQAVPRIIGLKERIGWSGDNQAWSGNYRGFFSFSWSPEDQISSLRRILRSTRRAMRPGRGTNKRKRTAGVRPTRRPRSSGS